MCNLYKGKRKLNTNMFDDIEQFPEEFIQQSDVYVELAESIIKRNNASDIGVECEKSLFEYECDILYSRWAAKPKGSFAEFLKRNLMDYRQLII